jgi:hypothetical protein
MALFPADARLDLKVKSSACPKKLVSTAFWSYSGPSQAKIIRCTIAQICRSLNQHQCLRLSNSVALSKQMVQLAQGYVKTNRPVKTGHVSVVLASQETFAKSKKRRKTIGSFGLLFCF